MVDGMPPSCQPLHSCCLAHASVRVFLLHERYDLLLAAAQGPSSASAPYRNKDVCPVARFQSYFHLIISQTVVHLALFPRLQLWYRYLAYLERLVQLRDSS
jgi:hypothetical protein